MQKKVELSDNLITPDQVKSFKESEFATDAKKLLQSPPKKLSREQYCTVRDFIFTEIHFSNACRSGVTANLMTKEFKDAKELPDGRFIIKVKHHKTRKTYGPANLTLKKQLFSFLRTFINVFRAKLPKYDDNVFLAWTGRAPKSGAISDRLHSVWVKCGVFDEEQKSKRIVSGKLLLLSYGR